MIKDLIVNLSVGNRPDGIGDFAISAAGLLNAQATGIAFLYEPTIPVSEFIPIPPDLIDMQREENERLAANAGSRFAEAARLRSVSASVKIIDQAPADAPETFARAARHFDLSIVAQPHPDSAGTDAMLIEATLFGSGRPMLVVPYIQRTGLRLDRVVVCWDGSRAAARAAADALPLLALAKVTELVTVADGSPRLDEIPGIDMAGHLSRHAVNAVTKRIVGGDVDAGNLILSHAADISADLIVMGGYGHSRLREFVLGGVTRRLLSSMTVPTLMSH